MFPFSLFRRSYQPLNTLTINKDNLLHNYQYLSNTSELLIAPVLKSNAYGHGLIQIAKILEPLKPPFFCIDSLYEGYELLKAGIKTPMLIMGYVRPEHLKVKRLPFWYAVYDLDFCKAVSRYQPQAWVHLFVDTGMHREGITVDKLPQFLDFIRSETKLSINGIMSHLGAGNKPELLQTQQQVKHFSETRRLVKQFGFHPQYEHIAATNGILNAFRLGDIGNTGRAGLALYGISSEDSTDLKPVGKLTSTLIQIKQLEKGEGIGYDFTFTAPKPMTVGILPLGYNDGVDRRLSNIGIVTIAGTECPIVGRVSMNLTTVDISGVSNPQIGDEVVVYDDFHEANNSIAYCAKTCKTIPYELLVHLHASTKREVLTRG